MATGRLVGPHDPPSAAVQRGSTPDRSGRGQRLRLSALVGSCDKIALFAAPFVITGVILNLAFPSVFGVGGPSSALRLAAIVVPGVGVTIWAWSVVLVMTKVRSGELVTSGPYALVKHPLYTAVALLILPSIGVLLNTWLGVAIGLVLYLGSRRYAPAEETSLSATFGAAWDAYRNRVKIPWL
jgi:protein-S-isoprenylcysteine O-methyltransferase Ste14